MIMKKLFTSISMLAVGAMVMTAVADDGQMFVANVAEAGTLEAVLGENLEKVKELKVVGPVNDADFVTMWKAGLYGTELLDLTDALVENEKIPEHALSNGNGKPLPEGADYPVKFKNIILGESVKESGAAAFATARKLEKVVLPSSLTAIDEGAFMHCWSLEEIAIPEGVATLPKNCLEDCTKLKSISLPSSLKSLEARSLYYTGLTELTLPDGLESIGAWALCNTALTEVVIPDGCRFDGEGVFAGCLYLEKAVLSDGMTELPDETFDGCYSLKDVVFPSTLTSIGEDAFNGCSFNEIKLPEGVRRIERFAFHNAYDNDYEGLYKVILPSTLEYIGENSFTNSGGRLPMYYCGAPVPPECGISKDGTYGPFGPVGQTGESTLNVYEEYLPLYKESPVWASFFSEIVGLPREQFDQTVGSEERISFDSPEVSVRVESGAVLIEGVAGESFVIAGTDGRTVAQGRLGGSLTRTEVAPGIYVVKAGREVCKVAVK